MTLDLRADCRRCAALCCVALAFDRSRLFAVDKPAGEVCRHLDGRHGCAIHAEREVFGFGGCVAFDCHGAGQFVVQDLFGSRSWRDQPELLPAMMAAFSAFRALHELAATVEAGLRQDWPEPVAETLEGVSKSLAGPWTLEEVTAGRIDVVVRAARQSLRGLGVVVRASNTKSSFPVYGEGGKPAVRPG